MDQFIRGPLVLRVNQRPDGVIYPDVNGIANATVNFQSDDANGVTGLLNFAGVNQAALIYDQVGVIVIGYHLFNPAAGMDTIASVESIIQYLNGAMLLDQVM